MKKEEVTKVQYKWGRASGKAGFGLEKKRKITRKKKFFFKDAGDIQHCRHYGGMKLTSYTEELREKQT